MLKEADLQKCEKPICTMHIRGGVILITNHTDSNIKFKNFKRRPLYFTLSKIKRDFQTHSIVINFMYGSYFMIDEYINKKFIEWILI